MSYKKRFFLLLVLIFSNQLYAAEKKAEYKRKFLDTKFISREDLIYGNGDKDKYGKFYVLNGELLITGIEGSRSSSGDPRDEKNSWFNQDKKKWRQVEIQSLLPFGFQREDNISYFSYDDEKTKNYTLKDSVNITMVKNDIFGDEGETFYRTFNIKLNDKSGKSLITLEDDSIDKATGLAYIGKNFILNSPKIISPKEIIVGVDNPSVARALDVANEFRSKNNWSIIAARKIIIRDYGRAQIISFIDVNENDNGREYEQATVLKLSDNKFADISDYSSNMMNGSAFNVIKAGEFIKDGLVLVFGATHMHDCIKIAVVRDDEVIIFRLECDLVGGC